MKKETILLALSTLLIFQGCRDDDDDDFLTPPPVNEEEVITRLELTFEETESGEEYLWVRSDPDGDGGNPPTFEMDTLLENSTFLMTIRLFNETTDPVEELTGEVEEEAEDHQFFFEYNEALDFELIYNDIDTDQNPIGLSNTVDTGEAESVILTVILRHQPDKFATDVAAGDITNAGGDTDIEVTFAGEVQ